MKDTIVAISTALGGAISIIRLSGESAIKIVNNVFEGKNLEEVDTHTIHYGYINDKERKIDEVLVTIMKAPKTYTTEDIVEINCHGGIATTNEILKLLISKNARLAEPGEFTKRAFLNNRIDLSEAEAVSDLINSKTEKARALALNQVNGKLSSLIKTFRQYILEILANIEVNIDYPEYEDIEEFTIKDLNNKIITIKEKLNQILKESENGLIIKNGLKVVIVGKPNVGKSSILNKFLNEEKAIVTDIEGTTRDIVEGSISLNGIMINLIDTAGLRETNDIIEKKGIDKTRKELDTADLILMVYNANDKLTEEDKEYIKNLNKKVIIVFNKDDLKNNKILLDNDFEYVYTNTVTENGIDNLKNKIISIFNLDEIESKDINYISNTRHIGIIKESLNIINDIEEAIKNNIPIDIIEIDLKRIWEKLGEILGENCQDELINQLFSQFCLGK